MTKPCATQRDLALAYSPGVAEPCRVIQKDPDAAYRYAGRGNLVAVVSNGTAVLGLGNIGALAGKPVMEGKAVLFKRFADIDVAETDPEQFVRIVAALEPTFGGINLEDIKAPECFYIEEELQRRVRIPVFHDDQHGTAIISGAALLNALERVGKTAEEARVVICGAGAAGIACADLYPSLGIRLENLLLVDTKGVIYKGRAEGMNPHKERFAQDTPLRTLAQALVGADIFVGVSGPGIVTPEMLRAMAPQPAIFAMANPDPEIPYPEAKKARPDAIVATGRSDFPNQVNNVLGFPFIFRGALDVRAVCVNREMKIAAVKALAKLAKEDVPDCVTRAYGGERMRFGPDYVIPKPFDPRVLLWVAPAVAAAAMETGVARSPIQDMEAYRDALEARLGKSQEISRVLVRKAQRSPKRIAFADGEDPRILRSAQIICSEDFARPILIGSEAAIREKIAALGLSLERSVIVDPARCLKLPLYAKQLQELLGLGEASAAQAARIPDVFAMLLVRSGEADGVVAGAFQRLEEVIAHAIDIIGRFEPRVALISFSNFGRSAHPSARKVARALEILRARAPDLPADGEMQADLAVTPELLNDLYPGNVLKTEANVLVFPDLVSASSVCKLLMRLGEACAVGPILAGLSRPVQVLPEGCGVEDVVTLATLAVRDAQVMEGG